MRKVPWLPVVGAAAGIAVVVAMAWLLFDRPTEPVEAAGPEVTATPFPTRSPTPTPTPTPTPGWVGTAAPERIEIPAVGIDLPVLRIDPDGGVIDPATVEDAYWIGAYGMPGTDATSTVYVVAHSSLSVDAAFNPLLDVQHQSSVLAAGDEVLLTTSNGVLRYEVTGSTRYGKSELPGAAEVWAIEPGVLHLITCFQEDGLARADDNLVVTARLVAGYPGRPTAAGNS